MDANLTTMIPVTLVGGLWMVRAGVSKRMLQWRRPDVCRTCGRPRTQCSCPAHRRLRPPEAGGAA
jgi:hypothetical protein